MQSAIKKIVCEKADLKLHAVLLGAGSFASDSHQQSSARSARVEEVVTKTAAISAVVCRCAFARVSHTSYGETLISTKMKRLLSVCVCVPPSHCTALHPGRLSCSLSSILLQPRCDICHHKSYWSSSQRCQISHRCLACN